MKYAPLIFAVVVLAISYNVWLDSGCPLEGYMTWHGKECVDLPHNALHIQVVKTYPDGSYLDTGTGQVGCGDPSKGCSSMLD